MGEHLGPRVTAKRLGVIGDVHTEDALLEVALHFLRDQQVDQIVCTGDLVDGPASGRAVERCCKLLRDHGALTVCGNHDRWLQDGEMRDLPDATPPRQVGKESLGFLAALPETLEIGTPVGDVLLCHGLGQDDMAGVQPFDRGYALKGNEALQALLSAARYVAVINGHTHRPMVRRIDDLTIINGGTLLRDQKPCCLVCDFEQRHVRFYDFDPSLQLSPGDQHAL